MQFIIDERASPEQRDALYKIMTGEDTEEMATMWWVFSAMSPNKLETLYKPIEFEMDMETRRGRIRVPGVFETNASPITNPVTGAEHRARIKLPHGFEFRVAEIAEGDEQDQRGDQSRRQPGKPRPHGRNPPIQPRRSQGGLTPEVSVQGSGLTERLLRRDRFVLIALIGVLFALTGLTRYSAPEWT